MTGYQYIVQLLLLSDHVSVDPRPAAGGPAVALPERDNPQEDVAAVVAGGCQAGPGVSAARVGQPRPAAPNTLQTLLCSLFSSLLPILFLFLSYGAQLVTRDAPHRGRPALGSGGDGQVGGLDYLGVDLPGILE